MTVAPLRAAAAARLVRARPTASLATALLALAFAFALVRLPSELRAIGADVRELRALPPDQRALVGAYSTDVDRTFLLDARRVIPPDATYAVVTGGGVHVSSPTTLAAAAPYLGYWLLPRVQVTDPRQADWIVSYGGDLLSLRLRFGRIVHVSPGLALTEVARP